MYAPTSFGWRDLLLDKSVNAEEKDVVLESGRVVRRNGLKQKDYLEKLAFYNYVGAALVSLWLCIFFMLVVAFGYSYFWSASSIIYLLMRQKVDDTEVDEIHMDDEEDDFTPPAYQPQDAKPPAENVTMVESPTLRTTPAPSSTTAPTNTSPPVERSAPKTMLAPPEADPEQKAASRADAPQAASDRPRPDLARPEDTDKGNGA
jgi:hypothetical protein